MLLWSAVIIMATLTLRSLARRARATTRTANADPDPGEGSVQAEATATTGDTVTARTTASDGEHATTRPRRATPCSPAPAPRIAEAQADALRPRSLTETESQVQLYLMEHLRDELRVALRSRGMSTTGLKADLATRLAKSSTVTSDQLEIIIREMGRRAAASGQAPRRFPIEALVPRGPSTQDLQAALDASADQAVYGVCRLRVGAAAPKRRGGGTTATGDPVPTSQHERTPGDTGLAGADTTRPPRVPPRGTLTWTHADGSTSVAEYFIGDPVQTGHRN
jgi:hypothetical protein